MSHTPESIQQAARKHCEEVILPNVDAWESSTEYPREAAAAAAADGLLGLYSPAEYGGQGLSFAESIPVYEELGKGEALYAFSLSMQNAVAYAVCNFGQPALRSTWASRLISGAGLGGFVITEPQSGSDAGGLRTRAEIKPDGSYTINGRKAWVSLAGVAEIYLVVVKTSDEPGHKDIAMVAVPKETPGVRFGEPYQKITSPFSADRGHVLRKCHRAGGSRDPAAGERAQRLADGHRYCAHVDRGGMLRADVSRAGYGAELCQGPPDVWARGAGLPGHSVDARGCGDRFGGEPPALQTRRGGVGYAPRTVSRRPMPNDSPPMRR